MSLVITSKSSAVRDYQQHMLDFCSSSVSRNTGLSKTALHTSVSRQFAQTRKVTSLIVRSQRFDLHKAVTRCLCAAKGKSTLRSRDSNIQKFSISVRVEGV